MGRFTERYFGQTVEGKNDIILEDLPKDLGAISFVGAAVTIFSATFKAPEAVTDMGIAATAVSGSLGVLFEAMRRWQTSGSGVQETGGVIKGGTE